MRSFKEHVTWVKRKSASLFQAGSARSTHAPPATRAISREGRRQRVLPNKPEIASYQGFLRERATGIEPAFSAWEGAVAPSAGLVFRVFGLLRQHFGLTVCSRLGPGLTGCCGTNVARRRNRSRASRASGRFV